MKSSIKKNKSIECCSSYQSFKEMLEGKKLYGKCMASEKGTAVYFAPFLNFFSAEMLRAVEELA